MWRKVNCTAVLFLFSSNTCEFLYELEEATAAEIAKTQSSRMSSLSETQTQNSQQDIFLCYFTFCFTEHFFSLLFCLYCLFASTCDSATQKHRLTGWLGASQDGCRRFQTRTLSIPAATGRWLPVGDMWTLHF